MLIYVMLLFMCRYSLNGSAYLDIFYGICNVICTYIYIYVCVSLGSVSVLDIQKGCLIKTINICW